MNPVDDFLEGFKEQPSCSQALSPQQRAFLDKRLGASLVVLASDFRQQFNTTAEQTCSLMNQWANT